MMRMEGTLAVAKGALDIPFNFTSSKTAGTFCSEYPPLDNVARASLLSFYLAHVADIVGLSLGLPYLRIAHNEGRRSSGIDSRLIPRGQTSSLKDLRLKPSYRKQASTGRPCKAPGSGHCVLPEKLAKSQHNRVGLRKG